jgi:hypothetical protein
MKTVLLVVKSARGLEGYEIWCANAVPDACAALKDGLKAWVDGDTSMFEFSLPQRLGLIADCGVDVNETDDRELLEVLSEDSRQAAARCKAMREGDILYCIGYATAEHLPLYLIHHGIAMVSPAAFAQTELRQRLENPAAPHPSYAAVQMADRHEFDRLW